MILTYSCEFGTPLPLNLTEKLSGNIEVECIEFISALPAEWRFVAPTGEALTDWQPGYRERASDHLRGLHDLQRPRRTGGTQGMPAIDATLETRGIGTTAVLIWPREGTFREKNSLQAEHSPCSW